MIRIKNTEVATQLLLHPYDPTLIEIVCWLGEEYPDITITCGYENRPGVHGTIPCRGIDIRSHIFPDPWKVVNHINDNWCYDPLREHKQVALCHTVGRGMHLHIQSHPNTKRIIKGE